MPRTGDVARDTGAMLHNSGVSLGRRDHVLDAVVDDLHRPTRLEREQRGVSGDHGRVLFLAPETAAGFGLNDADVRVREPEENFQCAMDVIRALNRPVYG